MSELGTGRRDRSVRSGEGWPDPTTRDRVMVHERLFIEATPISQLTAVADCLDHVGHDEFWSNLAAKHLVPLYSACDGYPRGRIVYNVKATRFVAMLDPCILNDPAAVSEILRPLKLDRVDTMEDVHYRCPNCMRER